MLNINCYDYLKVVMYQTFKESFISYSMFSRRVTYIKCGWYQTTFSLWVSFLKCVWHSVNAGESTYVEVIRTHSQMHHTGKYSQHSSIIWPVCLTGWVFDYELSGLWARILLQSLKLQILRLFWTRSSLALTQQV